MRIVPKWHLAERPPHCGNEFWEIRLPRLEDITQHRIATCNRHSLMTFKIVNVPQIRFFERKLFAVICWKFAAKHRENVKKIISPVSHQCSGHWSRHLVFSFRHSSDLRLLAVNAGFPVRPLWPRLLFERHLRALLVTYASNCWHRHRFRECLQAFQDSSAYHPARR